MGCNTSCKLCDRLIISTGVTFAAGVLLIDIPAGLYANNCDYCIVVAQAIPDTTTINSTVAITIGGAATQYPVLDKCCRPITACQIKTRTKYKTRVATSATGGNFKILNCLSNATVLNSLPAPEAATPTN